ncbi:MAG TPA: hypothetical protein VJT50_05155 [Pyrinomonadaceae bacterium]|nr:hypothetical protein [Pyrinomonadaceae bacterium]
MQKRVRLWTHWLVLVIVLLAVSAAVYAVIRTQSASANKDDLKISVGELRSYAAEARLLAEQADAGILTKTFLQAHVQKMHEHLQTLAQTLQSQQVDVNLEPARAKAYNVALVLDQSVLAIEKNQNGRNEIIARLGDLFSQLVQLEAELK